MAFNGVGRGSDHDRPVDELACVLAIDRFQESLEAGLVGEA